MSIVIPLDQLPVPKSLFEWAFAIVGWQLGNLFAQQDGEGFDEFLLKLAEKNTAAGWIGKISVWLLKRALHAFHHYWIGLLFMVFAAPIAYPDAQWLQGVIYWMGYGLFIEDGQFHLREFVDVVRKRL